MNSISLKIVIPGKITAGAHTAGIRAGCSNISAIPSHRHGCYGY
ncbi:hypothetical protein [Chitinophaga solisilvae]|nr:hypothetical protein [Chitinophaga solisilvae]